MRGVIAAGAFETAEAGAEMLRQGGNAVDAAVAAAFASLVAEAPLINIGGGGLALVTRPDGEGATVYDFLPTMPSGHPYKGMDFRRILVDFGPEKQPFYIGRASVAVPGFVAGLSTMHSKWGTLPFARVLEPAIRLAREGAVLSQAQAYVLDLLLPIFSYTPELAAVFTRGGVPYRAGDRLHFPQLANTLEKLAKEGPRIFYEGEIAEAIVDDQRKHGGLIQPADMAQYRVLEHTPIEISYRRTRLLLPPPPSRGGLLVGFALRILQGFPLEHLSHNSAEHIHLLAQLMRCTQVARKDWERDARPVPERLRWFLGDFHVRSYRAQLGQALHEPLGTPPSFPPGPPYTTHISVIDGEGLIVSLTTSAGENAGFLVGDTGICLNNMLGEIDLHPDGFHRLAPGERLATMMTPTVVLDNEGPRLITGSGGSNRIRSAILQVINNVLDFRMPVEEAVDRPRVHYEDGILQLEGGISPAVQRALERYGYTAKLWPDRNMFFGGAHSIAREDGTMVGAGDRRRGGAALVVD